MTCLVFRVTPLEGNHLELQMVTFGQQEVEMQWVLLDYLYYTIKKKQEIKRVEIEEQMKLEKTVEELKALEKSKLKQKEVIDCNG